MTKVAINGFGRIGRLVARAILENPGSGLELVSVNDLADAKANAWLFSRDSVHGKYPAEVTTDGTADHPYRSPSQADDGTIAAGYANEIVRMKQNGQVLNRIDPPAMLHSFVSRPFAPSS